MFKTYRDSIITAILALTPFFLSSCTITRKDIVSASTPANSTTSVTSIENLSPIGCNEIGDVYYFIKDYLIQENQNEKPTTLENLIKNEVAALQYEGTKYVHKPYIAEIYETELGHILRELCQAKPWCLRIIIYLKNGRAVAAGEQDNCHTFFEEEKRIAYGQPFFDEQSLAQEKTTSSTCKTMFSDKCAQLGFLYPNPTLFLGTETLTNLNGAEYQQITKAVCFNSKINSAYLSSNLNKNDEVIGYIRYYAK
ncbi:MAG: hypothetical protein LBJ71_03040 [Holosporaceae bacterium]|jgi:hypothetical protein|nr:hypothetical protein [Holosporaceae bacterium]